MTVALLPCAGSPVPAMAATSATTQKLQTLAREMTFDDAKSHPLTATAEGIAGEDDRLDTPSPAEVARDLATIRRWKAELAAIPLDGATLVERDDAKLLQAQLVASERGYTVYKTYEKDYSAPSQAIVGAIFTQFQHLPATGSTGSGEADRARAWHDIVARLTAAPRYIAAGEALVTSPGRLYNTVGAEELAGAPDFMNGALTAAAKAQLSAGDFRSFAAARAATLAAIASAKTYIDAHAAAWPETYAKGRAAYDAMLRDEQLLPFDSRDIERMANDELAHGWAEQSWVENDAKERGTPIGPQSGGGLAPSGTA
ncbi:MAG: DUF885 family protein, partial [Candidatus Eremiobacteraeota bacterium]|nr:DUF885 family protein [Candidatus Eremiobacteraeota bacterium]